MIKVLVAGVSMPIKTCKHLTVFRESYGLALEILVYTKILSGRRIRARETTPSGSAVDTSEYCRGMGKTYSRGGIQQVLADCDRLV